MCILSGRLGLALVLAALCLGGRTAHAQAAPVNYWIPAWPVGFGGNPTVGQNSNAYGNFPSFDGSDARSSSISYIRYNFPQCRIASSESAGMRLRRKLINRGCLISKLASPLFA